MTLIANGLATEEDFIMKKEEEPKLENEENRIILANEDISEPSDEVSEEVKEDVKVEEKKKGRKKKD